MARWKTKGFSPKAALKHLAKAKTPINEVPLAEASGNEIEIKLIFR